MFFIKSFFYCQIFLLYCIDVVYSYVDNLMKIFFVLYKKIHMLSLLNIICYLGDNILYIYLSLVTFCIVVNFFCHHNEINIYDDNIMIKI